MPIHRVNMLKKSFMKKPFVLIDGTSYLYRAFHALPPLSNSRGEPTGAVYGVITMLRKLIKEINPDYAVVVFDAKGKTFREELYTDYKAHRPTMPNDLQQQIEPLYTIIRRLGLPLIIHPGVEADDVIGTLAAKAIQQQWPVLISTGDKDFAQLVSEQVTLVNTMTNTQLDRQGVIDKFGVTPEQITDYLSLIGDPVDNVPGIPNVGPKTAAKWLKHYGNLESIIKNADEIKGKVGENLKIHLDKLTLSRQLVTIKKDVDLEFDLEKFRLRTPDTAALMECYKKLEFKGWLRELEQNQQADTPVKPVKPTQATYTLILDKTSFQTFLKQLTEAKIWAFDTETTSLDVMHAELVGLSFAFKCKKPFYIPLAHNYLGAPQQLPRDWVLQQLKPLFEDPNQLKIGHHLKYDMSVLANYGIQLQGLYFDTLIASYLLDSASNSHSLDSAAIKHLDHKTILFEEIAGKGSKQKTFNQIDIQKAGPYASEDAEIAFRLQEVLKPQLEALPGLFKVFSDIEMPLVPVLSRIERHGVLVDAQLLKKQSLSIAKRLLKLEEKAYQMAGKAFNLGSPKQLQTVLFVEQSLPILEKTPKGQASTSENVLQALARRYPLAKVILKHRSLSKLKSTYTDKLPERINPETGRIHTSYHQAAVVTGRLSSSDPNLQNIPARTEEGRKIRAAFIAPPGYKILAADYSQIELRIVAHFSQDKGLLDAFAQGLDIHQATAAEVLNIPLYEVTPEQRRSAKAVNFGLIYGMSSFGLSRQLGISREEAKNYIERYFDRYPGVKEYMERTRQQAHEHAYVTTLFKRRLNLAFINSNDPLRRRASERAAINAPLQGTAADIIKKAMIAIDQALSQQRLNARMIMQVHDELVFEVANADLKQAQPVIENLMVNTTRLSVPLIVDSEVGLNWNTT
jgi:DNA polymerase I